MPVSLVTLIRRAAVVAALGLLATLAATVVLALLVRTTQHEERHARQTLVTLYDVALQLRTAQAATRGYVIAPNPLLLAPLDEALSALDDDLRAVQERLGTRYPRFLAELRQEVQAWLALNRTQLARVRRGDRAEAVSEVASGRGERRIRAAERAIGMLAVRERDRVQAESARVGRLLFLLALALGVAVALAAAGGVLLTRRVVRDVVHPLAGTGAAARRLGIGDLAARAPTAGVREIAALGASFNAMAGQMEQLMDELRRVDEVRAQLVSSVSHELRTPLTSIRGYTELLAADEAGPITEEQREHLEVIRRNADRLQTLIADLLTLARVDAGRLRLEPAPVDLAELAGETARELGPLAAGAGIALDVDSAARLEVLGDEARLRQALTNLIGNAIKFSRAGTRVSVRARERGSEAVVEVEDEGVGIAAADVPRLTERFFRAESAHGVEGTGLGLSITSAIAKAHRGDLEIESVEGEGSTFRLVLPRA